MRNSSHLIRTALSSPDLLRRSIRRRTYVGLLVATTSATVFLSGSAHRAMRRANGTARGTNPGRNVRPAERPHRSAVRWRPASSPADTRFSANAVRRAHLAAAAALDRVRQADTDVSAIACAKAFDEAKHHWIIPPLS